MTRDDYILAALPALQMYALKLTRDRDAAADLVNDTVLRAMECFHQFAPGTNFKAWTMTIMCRRFYDGSKRARRVVSSDPSVIEDVLSIPAAQDRFLDRATIKGAVSTLSPDHRAILEATVFSELDYQQAAELLGIPMGTVRSRKNRAINTLRKILDVEFTPTTSPGDDESLGAFSGAEA